MIKLMNNFSLRKLLYNRKFTIPFSIFIAFVFWLIITTNQNPIRQQTFSDVPITINLENTVAGENGMDIVSDISNQKFSVTVSWDAVEGDSCYDINSDFLIAVVGPREVRLNF